MKGRTGEEVEALDSEDSRAVTPAKTPPRGERGPGPSPSPIGGAAGSPPDVPALVDGEPTPGDSRHDHTRLTSVASELYVRERARGSVEDLTLAYRSTIVDTLAVLGREGESEAALEIIAAVKEQLGLQIAPERRRFRNLWQLVVGCLVLLTINICANFITGKAVSASRNGALHLPSEPVAVGTAELVELHSLNEYATLPVEKLRRVNDITFEHKGVVHYFKVSSFRKFSDAHIVFMSPERSVISIANGRVKFSLPFETEQELDVKLPQPPSLRGAFKVQTNDPEVVGSNLPPR